MPTTAHDVSALLIHEQHAVGRTIDKMQLQKLLYVVQGANLVFWGAPAFREPLLAYRNGPVVANIESTYRESSDASDPLDRPLGGRPKRLDEETIETVHTVLRFFGEWTGPNLERYTKSTDSPWWRARGDLPPDAPSTTEIPLADIESWFARRGVDPNMTRDAYADPSPDRRRAADEALGLAQAKGAFAPELPPDVAAIAEGALARVAPADRTAD